MPIIAVARELKKQHPDCQIIYIGEKGAKYGSMFNEVSDIDKYYNIYAGKFRRYYGESWLKQILDIKTNLLNIRDFFLFITGTFQSIILIKKIKPNVIFLKGGFVGVPVGLASALWKFPIVTHDSDVVPGLANRLMARWAVAHATGQRPENYAYDKSKTHYVGVLVDSVYRKVTPELQNSYKRDLGIEPNSKVLMITGGSNGSVVINKIVRQFVPDLLSKYSDLTIVHQTGKKSPDLYKNFIHHRLMVFPLLKNMYKYSGASELIVTRAGANTMAEFGVQAKACIVIPNPLLADGHQIKNGQLLASNKAAIVIEQQDLKTNPEILMQNIEKLLYDDKARSKLAAAINNITLSNATQKLAHLIVESANK